MKSDSIFDIFRPRIKTIIEIPANLSTDRNGFNFLSKLFYDTSQKGVFVFDFSKVEWFEANLCAVLGLIIISNKEKGATFSYINLNTSTLRATLFNNGFLNLLGDVARKSGITSGIPLRNFDMKNESEVEEYIYKYLLSTSRVPKMSEGAKRKIYRSIFEVYQNSVMHSGAEKIFVCGQFYPRAGRLSLTMVEIGHTFKHNVTSYDKKYANYSGAECIEWAVKSGNTTKNRSETGGLGLDLIREFLRLNNGKLQIKSAEGYWEEKKGITFAENSNNSFAGSIVNIEFNLRDTKSYYVKEDIDINDIL